MKTNIRLLISTLLLAFSGTSHAQLVYTFAGTGTSGYSGDGGSPNAAQLYAPAYIAVDNADNVYVTDQLNNVVRKITTTGFISTIAGNGIAGFSGDNGQATAASLQSPEGIAIDASGNIYIADKGNARIRRIATNGIITTIAGTGTAGATGNGGPATAAMLNSPSGMAVDASGNVYIADAVGNTVRRINTSGTISAYAGLGAAGGYSGDGGPATAALLSSPASITMDIFGNLLIADKGNNVIRKVTPSGIISTMAGTGTAGNTGDGGAATAALLSAPSGILADNTGNIYISEQGNHRIRKITAAGMISNMAGTGTAGYSGDEFSAIFAQFNTPRGIAMDGTGSIFVADYANNVVRIITTDIAPFFTGGPNQDMVVCQGGVQQLDTFLTFYDADAWQTETWSIISAPLHGTFTGFPNTSMSTGDVVVPSGIYYTPTPGYSGTDGFTIRISDGQAISLTHINVTINPAPSVDQPADMAVCNGATASGVTLSGPLPGSTYSWTNNNPAIGLAASGTGNVPSFTAVNTGNTPQYATITATPAYTNGCPGIPKSYTITVNPTPTADQPANQSICNGTATAATTFTGAVSGTTYLWTNNNTGIGLAASGSGDIASFTITNAASTATMATITVIPSVNGCPGTSKSFTITAKPSPAISTIADKTACNGAAVSATTFSSSITSATYSWANSNTATGLAASGTGNISSFVTSNSTGATLISTVNVTATAAGCSGSSASFTIAVYPTTTMAALSSQALCSGTPTSAVSFNTSGGNTYSWTNDNSAIGLASSGTGNIPSFTAVNGLTNTQIANITVTPAINGCPGTAQTMQISVYPSPMVTMPENQSVCAGSMSTAVSFGSATAGTTYSWTNNNTSIGLAASGTGSIASFSAINTTNSNAIATITVIPAANGCNGNAATYTITVKPAPDVVIVPPSQAVCTGAPTTAVNFTNASGGTTVYNWTNNNTSIGLAASGNGSIASFAGINTGTVTSTATLMVTPMANGCTGATENFTISVYPAPIVATIANQVVCNGAATSAVNFSATPAGTTYSWTNDNTNTGLAASGTGNIASFTAANATSGNIISNITVSPSANGCTGASTTFAIAVKRMTDVAASLATQTVCNGATTQPITFSSTTSGATYSWTNNNTSIGLVASGTGDIAAFTAGNSTSTATTATVTVTAAANGCSSTAHVLTITALPTPVMAAIPGQVLCNGAATNAITFSTAGGNTYSWTNDNSNMGLAASGTGDIASFTAINNLESIQIANITVTPSNAGCQGAPQTTQFTIYPTPGMSMDASQSVCTGSATLPVGFNSMTAGTTYSWTNNNTGIGLAASGTGSIASFTATNNTNSNSVATITVTPQANGCTGTARVNTITVKPAPDVVIVPPSQSVCSGAPTTAVNFTNASAGTTVYNWSNNNTGIGLAASGNGSIASFTGVNTGSVTATATLMVTPMANGCTGATESFTISVYPAPTVVTTASQVLCNGAATTPVTFTGSPASVTYSWNNDNTTTGLAASGNGNIASFTAINNGSGTATSIITVSPSANGCTGASQTFTIAVKRTTDVVITGGNQTVCNGAQTSLVNFSSTTSGTSYSWINNNTTTGLAASGTGNIAAFTALNNTASAIVSTITVSPVADGCSGAAQTFTITVNPTPAIATVANQSLCNGVMTSATSFGTGGNYSWTNDNTSIGLAASGTGNIPAFAALNATAIPSSATITVSPIANGCSGAATSFTIAVKPSPIVNSIASQAICNGQATTPVTFAGAMPGATYSWTNNNTTTGLAASGTGDIASFTAANTAAADAVSTIIVTPVADGCVGSATSFNITVKPTPSMVVAADQARCNGAVTDPVALGSDYTWTNNNTSIGLPASGIGSIASFAVANSSNTPASATITYMLTANGCTGTRSFAVNVNPTPAMEAIASQQFCSGTATVPVHFTSPVAATTYTWANNNAAIGIATTGTGDIASFTPVTTATPVAATITVTPSAGGCAGPATSFQLVVNPAPSLTSTTTPVAICDNVPFSYDPQASSAASFAWSRAAIAGINNSAAWGTGNPGERLINTSAAPLTVTYTYTVTAGTCSSVADVKVLVKPTPSLSGTLTPAAVCDGTTFSYAPSATAANASYAWTRPYILGLSMTAASGTGSISEQMVNSTTAGVSAVYTYTVAANGCSSVSDVAVLVNPTPQLSSILSTDNCSKTAFRYSPACKTEGALFTWSRATVDNVIPATASGNGLIDETLTNMSSQPVTVIYSYSLMANGCTHTQDVALKLNPGAVVPMITTAPPSAICANTYYQNFGTATVPAAGVEYTWSADNAELVASGRDNQYAIFNFPASGIAVVRLTASAVAGCSATDSFVVNAGPSIADAPAEVIYVNNQFVALQNNEEGYQWGYDDAVTLDSTIIPGALNQNYFNDNPQFESRLYWVMVTHNGCTQKSYYKVPKAGAAATAGLEVKIYPNPAQEKINVDITSATTGNIEVRVFNLLGQRISTTMTATNRADINVAGLASGCYMIDCYKDGAKIASSRFIKQ